MRFILLEKPPYSFFKFEFLGHWWIVLLSSAMQYLYQRAKEQDLVTTLSIVLLDKEE